jgi:Na+-driven multidrug efflux pump
MSAAGMIMITFVNGFGARTAAAYIGALQVWNYIQMPGFAVGASVSSMAGQNVGAGRWDRVERIALSGLGLSLCVTGSIAILIYLMGPLPLYIFLPPGSPTIPIALHIDRITLWAFVIFAATFVLSGIVRSTGAIWVPLAILCLSMFGVRVCFAWQMMAHFGHNADFIWWSFPLGTLVSSALTALYFRYGGWRKVRMLRHFPTPPESEDTPQAPPHLGAEKPADSLEGEVLAS